jgi:hypothetical protein
LVLALAGFFSATMRDEGGRCLVMAEHRVDWVERVVVWEVDVATVLGVSVVEVLARRARR